MSGISGDSTVANQSSIGQWRYPRTKIKHLVTLGVTLDMAVKHAIGRKKYWRTYSTQALRFAMTNEWPVFNYTGQQGLVSLKQLWYEASLRGTALYRRGQRRTRMLGGMGLPSAMAATTRFRCSF